MNNETRVSSLVVSGDPLAGTCAQYAPAYNSRMTVVTITGTTIVTTTTTTTTTTERRYVCGSRVRRPRLLKVRDGSVAETLPSFAFNPDPHFVGTWSILHLPPFPVGRSAIPFLPPWLGQPGERAPHCLSFSPAISAHVSFSPSFSRLLPLTPAAILCHGSPRSLSPSRWITIVLGIQ